MAYEAPSPAAPALDEGQTALLDLLGLLDERGYRFAPVTPSSHRRVVERRRGGVAHDLRDFLGWSLPARPGEVDPDIFRRLQVAEALDARDDLIRSTLRVSSIGDRLFLHSAWPTQAPDSVFLGPDSCRFARQIDLLLDDGGRKPRRIVDIGAGAGVGAIVAARLAPRAAVQMTDVNPSALRLAAVNAAAAGVRAELIEGPGVEAVAPGFDLAVANPPFMTGSSRTYSAGGGAFGEQLSLDWARAALGKLAPGGRFLLYTGSAIREGGGDAMRDGLQTIAQEARAGLDYTEVDPDIFGEVLSMEAYAGIERIAAVCAVLSAPDNGGR